MKKAELAEPQIESDIQPVGHDQVSDEPQLLAIPASDQTSGQLVHQNQSEWTLSDLEAAAIQNNPAIHQASASAFKSMGYREQVGLRPNPVLGYQGSQLADRGTDQHVAFVEQDLVLGDKLQKNRNVLSQDVQVQLWEVEAQRYRVLTDVRRLYYTALAAQMKREIAIEYQQKAKTWHQQAVERNAAGEGNKLEIGQSILLLRNFELLEQQADAEFNGTWKQLMAISGTQGAPVGHLSGNLLRTEQRNTQEDRDRILSLSPELHAARARLCRAQANLDRQESQVVPNLSVMLAAGRDNGTGSSMINTQVGVPIQYHNRNQGNISAAHAEVCRASQNIRRVELSLEASIALALQQWESAHAAVEKYKNEIIPQADETLNLMEVALRAEGNVTFVEVLISRKTAFDAQWEYIAVRTDLAKASSMLDGLVLSGGLTDTPDTVMDSGLRDQSLYGR